MKIAEIAGAFDMSIAKFADCIGYSRPALYNSAFGKHETRRRSVIDLLDMRSRQMLEADKELAEKKYRERQNAIQELSKIMDGGKDG